MCLMLGPHGSDLRARHKGKVSQASFMYTTHRSRGSASRMYLASLTGQLYVYDSRIQVPIPIQIKAVERLLDALAQLLRRYLCEIRDQDGATRFERSARAHCISACDFQLIRQRPSEMGCQSTGRQHSNVVRGHTALMHTIPRRYVYIYR